MPAVNESKVDFDEYDRVETTFRRKELSNAAAGEDLGCSLYELPPQIVSSFLVGDALGKPVWRRRLRRFPLGH